jgi:hypothetical protein
LLAPWNPWYIKRVLMYEDRVKSRYSGFPPFVIADFITVVSTTATVYEK